MQKSHDPIKLTKILNAQFKKACKEPVEHIKFYMSPEDCKTWYVLLHHLGGDNNEYDGGEYLVRMQLPEDFPFSPPSFYFMTHNGLYSYEKKVCISIGEYHKDEYRASLGVLGFTKNLISGMIGWKDMGAGINLLKPKEQDLRKHATESVAFNREKNAQILQKVNECFENYSAAWKVPEDADPDYKKRIGF